MDEQAFQQATQGTTPMRDVTSRQISNGFVLQGVTRYVDPTTKQARVALQDEAVATSADDAAVMAASFIKTGKFDG